MPRRNRHPEANADGPIKLRTTMIQAGTGGLVPVMCEVRHVRWHTVPRCDLPPADDDDE